MKAKICLPSLRIPWNSKEPGRSERAVGEISRVDMAQSGNIKTQKPQ